MAWFTRKIAEEVNNREEDNEHKVEKRPKNMPFVGHVDIPLVETQNGKTRDFVVPISFYMNEKGERSIRILTHHIGAVEWVKKYRPIYTNCLLWEQGGPFPEEFEPNNEQDILANMLIKLTQKKLIGEE